jgi:DNA-binding CsgD family transcriptional regulator
MSTESPKAEVTTAPVAMSFYRDVGKEAFSSDECEVLSGLTPHLEVDFQNYWAAESLHPVINAYRHALNIITSAVFGIEPKGFPSFANRTGEELLRQGRWLQIRQGELGLGKGVLEVDSFAKALRRLSESKVSFNLVVTDAGTGAQAIAGGSPIPAAQANPFPKTPTALVWLTPIVPDQHVAGDLATLFGLTHAEVRLVGRLITDDDLREAARTLHISLHTARTQLKSVFAKTGRRTQAALLTLVTRLSALRMPIA